MRIRVYPKLTIVMVHPISRNNRSVLKYIPGPAVEGEGAEAASLKVSASERPKPCLSRFLLVLVLACWMDTYRRHIMTPRRSHTKSRNGCGLCKQRRVKCDEGGPPCNNCTTRGLECFYAAPAPSQRAQSQSTSTKGGSSNLDGALPSHLQPSAPSPSPSQDLDGQGALSMNTPSRSATSRRELELLYRWHTKTSLSFSPILADQFQHFAVEEAIKHDYLMDFILAFTSLHQASETSDHRSAVSYFQCSLRYQNMAMPAFRNALQSVDASNCDAVFAAAVLMMATSITSAFLPLNDGDEPKSVPERILLILNFLKGTSSVIEACQPWLAQGVFAVILSLQPSEPVRQDQMLLAPRILKDLNDRSVREKSLHGIYESEIDKLEMCMKNKKSLAIPWLSQVSTEFTVELQQRMPMALVVLMYWGAVLCQLDGIWWAQYAGKKIVEQSSTDLLRAGTEWHEATKWAMAQIGLS
ncbi:hypothetical protein BP5796_07612 [Coleophoma crateriformis]|uniref:Zn(2)-C6 fungal-type domain-containing protein n=1 Tax=Coleophoma crateriformis TaxID=565419 RepID=A0A3D8RJL9_9HELO|nr:hypothetical protein BP5796_07612 [Coleophoma crateriformis]